MVFPGPVFGKFVLAAATDGVDAVAGVEVAGVDVLDVVLGLAGAFTLPLLEEGGGVAVPAAVEGVGVAVGGGGVAELLLDRVGSAGFWVTTEVVVAGLCRIFLYAQRPPKNSAIITSAVTARVTSANNQAIQVLSRLSA